MAARKLHRIRLAPLLALLVGVALIPASLWAALSNHRDDLAVQKRALANEADQQAESLRDYFGRARSLTEVMGANPAFAQFYELPGNRTAKVRAQGPTVRQSQRALSFLEKLFPESIGEACFIDRAGPENARAVKGDVAPLSDLSLDETAASFFKPTFDLRPGEVYQAKPYVSPDTSEWVIANSIPIRARGARVNNAIVHFEITVESFRRNAAQSSERFDVAIVDARSGRVVVDSRYRQRDGAKATLGRPADRRFASLVDDGRKRASFETDDRSAAFERVGRERHNANDWIAVAVARTPTGSWIDSLGASDLAILIGALLLLGFAVTNLRSSQRELREAALTDPLTGLANRRSLIHDLESTGALAERPRLLLLFDLDGFKAYNDGFGHPAGDALLARLGRKLEKAVRSERGSAYRMGGDEFCVLAPVGIDEVERIEAIAAAALSEHGEGFSITASCGSVLLPTEAEEPSEALRKADQRMYARKGSGRASAARQSTNVLLTLLSERSPELGVHLDEVTELCEDVGNKLGLQEEEMGHLLRAAALHDIGKAAIPDEILNKPGPLDESELAFIRRHTLIGERIVAAAAALTDASKLVRWSHERFDGAGYPDGLSGHDIPLGARIIAVADAFDAMVSGRPYRPAVMVEAALAELRRCAGTQFDPDVVSAFVAVVAERRAAVAVT
jgi:diguanylate cyclase (GGDEF)-like protein